MTGPFAVRCEQCGDNETMWAVWDESTQRIFKMYWTEAIAREMAAILNARSN